MSQSAHTAASVNTTFLQHAALIPSFKNNMSINNIFNFESAAGLVNIKTSLQTHVFPMSKF